MNPAKCPHPRSYVHPDESLSRFVYDAAHIRNGVKQAVFRMDDEKALSVYRTTDHSPEYIWHICDTYGRKGKPAAGRAELSAKAYTDNGLSFEPDGKPHTRHVCVIGWNMDKYLETRQELARRAKAYMRPD